MALPKTSRQVQGDIYKMLKESSLPELITGDIYRSGTRPRNSELEDLIVIFTTGTADQLQTGIVTLNLYVSDIDSGFNGIKMENIRRCQELEEDMNEWVASMTADKSDYLFRLAQSIYTENEQDIEQHFVVVKLEYRLVTF